MATLKTESPVVIETEVSGITKEQFLQYTKNRQFISSADKYALKVRSVNQWVNPQGKTVAIINFDAITSYHMGLIKDFIKAGDLQEASNTVLTGNVRVGIDYVPSKGEIVNVEIVSGTTKAGESALFVQGVTPRPVAATTSVDFSSMFD